MDILIIRIFEEFLKHFSTGEKYKGKIKLEKTFLKKKKASSYFHFQCVHSKFGQSEKNKKFEKILYLNFDITQ